MLAPPALNPKLFPWPKPAHFFFDYLKFLNQKGLSPLLQTYKVYETQINRYSHASTDQFTPDSPHLLPRTIEDVPQVITITLVHHNYAVGNVDHDLLFAKKDDLIRPYWYQKTNKIIQPQPLQGWNQVSRLLKHQPDDFGATIESWEQPHLYSDHYELQTRLSLHKISLADFLTRVKG